MTEREKSVYMSLAPVVAKDSNLDEILSRRAANGFSIAIPPVQGYSGSTTVSMMFPKISRYVLRWLIFSFRLCVDLLFEQNQPFLVRIMNHDLI